MLQVAMKRNIRLATPALALLLAACSSFQPRSVDASGYAAMSCVELNERIAEVSSKISRTAVTRGEVERTNIPGWVLGGQRVADRVADRQSASIESLQEEERALTAARRANCGR